MGVIFKFKFSLDLVMFNFINAISKVPLVTNSLLSVGLGLNDMGDFFSMSYPQSMRCLFLRATFIVKWSRV